jgi:hypothetical protein
MLMATAWTSIADNTGSTPATLIYNSLHTASPTITGNQTSSEIGYTSYVRKSTSRASGSGGWDETGGSATLHDLTSFAAGTGGSGTATHWGFGLSSTSTGTLQGYGTISPSIVTGNGITPQLTTASSIALS